MMHTLLPPEIELRSLLVDISLRSGVNMVLAKVIAELFAEGKEISLDLLASRTGYSLSSISNSTKQLSLMGKIKRYRKPGTKKMYAIMSDNFVQSLHNQFLFAIKTVIIPMQKSLPKIISDLKKELKSKKLSALKKEDISHKLVWYKNYMDQMKTMAALFEHMEEHFRNCEKKGNIS